RQIALLQLLTPMKRDRTAAQSLHREREVGKSGMPGQRLTHETQRPRIQSVVDAAVRARHGIAQPTVFSEPSDQLSARVVELGYIVHVRQIARSPLVEPRGQCAVRLVEERPVEISLVAHSALSASASLGISRSMKSSSW